MFVQTILSSAEFLWSTNASIIPLSQILCSNDVQPLKVIPVLKQICWTGAGLFWPMISWIFSEVKRNSVVVLYRVRYKLDEFCRERCYLLLHQLKMSVVQFLTAKCPHCLGQQACWDLLSIFQSLFYLIFINICFYETCLENVCDKWPLPHSREHLMAF